MNLLRSHRQRRWFNRFVINNEIDSGKGTNELSTELLSVALAGLYETNTTYQGTKEQEKYGNIFYTFLLMACEQLGAITFESYNKESVRYEVRDKILLRYMKFLANHYNKNYKKYIYSQDNINASISIETFPEFNNIALVVFNDTFVLSSNDGDIRTRDWSGLCRVKENILKCRNKKDESEKYSFLAKINNDNIEILEDNGFSLNICGPGPQALRNKYYRTKIAIPN